MLRAVIEFVLFIGVAGTVVYMVWTKGGLKSDLLNKDK